MAGSLGLRLRAVRQAPLPPNANKKPRFKLASPVASMLDSSTDETAISITEKITREKSKIFQPERVAMTMTTKPVGMNPMATSGQGIAAEAVQETPLIVDKEIPAAVPDKGAHMCFCSLAATTATACRIEGSHFGGPPAAEEHWSL